MKKLEQTILTKSSSGNHYIFDRKMNHVLLSNPIMHYLLQQQIYGVDISHWIDSIVTFPINLPGCGNVSRQELDYYKQKILFLQNFGYFSEQKEKAYEVNPIIPKMIEFSIANTRQVTFEITEQCNLKCKYCGYGSLYKTVGTRKKLGLDINKALSLLNYLVPYLNSHMNVSRENPFFISFYGGEPLLNMEFIKQIVQYAKNLNLKYNTIQFSITTNALLLAKYMDFLVENEFNLLISLDGDKRCNSYRVFKNGKPAYNELASPHFFSIE